MAEVTVGMPLYNNARTLRSALNSLLAQTVRDIHILISDDCSNDSTAAICEEYVRCDPRVTYVRQAVNLGYQNFRFVLERCGTPFFMWAAGDDRWAPTFIEKNLRALKCDDSLVASISRVCFDCGDDGLRQARGTYPLLAEPEENIARFLCAPRDNSRQYALYRTEVLRRSFPEDSFHAYDWAISAATLLHGKHNELTEVLMFRDPTPGYRYTELVRWDHYGMFSRLFPLLQMTRWLLFSAKIPRTWRIAGALLALNVDKHYEYCERFHPRYFRASAMLQKLWNSYVQWRLRAWQSRAI
jgi:glycosyltransferase involved in cell wall biosynthesis